MAAPSVFAPLTIFGSFTGAVPFGPFTGVIAFSIVFLAFIFRVLAYRRIQTFLDIVVRVILRLLRTEVNLSEVGASEALKAQGRTGDSSRDGRS